ncbi:MAG: FprA family A-type flavoprotein [Deltaproteobacteria bacterium]|nr:FprA family A-type flavoprotein [Deltaproteobacteria bacterium]
MKARKISNTVTWLGAIDWDRRLFDSLIPLPDGTTYNAYLVRGDSKTALIDTVDPSMAHVLLRQLEDVPQVDYVISNHAEKDHSGAIPEVLKRYPEAVLLTSDRAVNVLVDSLKISHERIRVVKDNETVDLGGRTLEFLYTPWVHWPETMVTYLQEEGLLFSCDFLGCHIASSDLYVTDKARVAEAAKRYFAEIMMPFRNHIRKHLDRLANYPIKMVAPSHGPIHSEPHFILDAYREWAAEEPKNLVVIPFVSMHGSTEKMVDCLVESLVEKGVNVERYDLAVADIGKLATALVDAATIVVATPTVLGGPHPLAAYAAVLANALKPKAKYLSVIGSYGWGGKSVEALAGMIPNLNVVVVEPYLTKGSPDQIDCDAIDKLASAIAERHASL